jgi:hypothetical protein
LFWESCDSSGTRGRCQAVRIGQDLEKGGGRGPLRQSQKPAPQLMASSIPPKKPSEIACDVALELRLPWRVAELRGKALEAYRTATRRAASSGLPPEQADESIRRFTAEQVKRAAEGMDRLPPDERRPTPERLTTALEAFDTEEWIGLIDGLDQIDTRALLSHIREHEENLKQRIGAGKVLGIKDGTIMRDIELWLVENRTKLVPISDVDWAIALPDLVREVNLARATNHDGSGRPAKGRSVTELGSDRSIARLLSKRDEQTGHEMNVSPYDVKRWRERAEGLPFAQYAADVGADDEEKRAAARIDYWAMIRRKHQRKRN